MICIRGAAIHGMNQVLDNVAIHFLDKRGKLSAGFGEPAGVPNARTSCANGRAIRVSRYIGIYMRTNVTPGQESALVRNCSSDI